MVFVTVVLTATEWQKIAAAAYILWPNLDRRSFLKLAAAVMMPQLPVLPQAS